VFTVRDCGLAIRAFSKLAPGTPAAVSRTPDSSQITLPRPLLIGFGVFAVLMLCLLAAQIVLLSDQLRTVRTQRSIAERQAARTLPLLDAIAPLVRDSRSSAPELRRGAGRLDRLVRGAIPLVADLRAARAPEAARATLALASVLLDARVGATSEAVRTLSVQLTEAEVGPAVAAIASELQRDARLRRLLTVSVETLEDADRRRLVAHLDTAARTAPRVEGAARELLSAQRDALAILKESLTIQRETLRHAESLDRKTGPTAPDPPASTTGR
jgi:hypothetical protein